MRKAAAIIVGLIAGSAANMAIVAVSYALYPTPADFDPADPEAMAAYIGNLPIGAILLVLAAHTAQSFVGSVVAALVVGRSWLTGAWIIGIISLAAGVANLLMIPHPNWFAAVDVLVYIPAALAGWWVVGAMRRDSAPAPESP